MKEAPRSQRLRGARRPHHAPQRPGPGSEGTAADPQSCRQLCGPESPAPGDEKPAARESESLPGRGGAARLPGHVLSGVGQRDSEGELAALQWTDLDAERRTISVSRQATKDEAGDLVVTRPKTENSILEISIPQKAVELLIREHAKHPNNPWLFPSSRTGAMYHPDSVATLHQRILKDAGLEHLRFHDLRHTFATLALQNGVDIKTVYAMLGHYDAGFTLRTYTHTTRQKQDEAAQTMGNLMAQVR